MPDVLIIGAGMAGLACARELQRRGQSVRLLDKGRRPGGRVASRVVDGLHFDHGAQFMSVRDPDFDAALAPARSAGVLQAWAAPGRRDTVWVGAPHFQALPQRLAEGLDLRCGTEVRAVTATAGGWRLRLRNAEGLEEEDRCRRLVLTPPAPQVQALLGEAAPAVLAGIAYAPCWTLMLRAAQPLALPLGADPHPDIGWITAEADKPGRDARPRWTVQASAAWSTRHLEASPEQVAARLRETLAALAEGAGAALEVLAVHRWRYARVTAALPGPLWDAGRGLGIAGDGLGGGRIEAAWRSGWALAAQMLATA